MKEYFKVVKSDGKIYRELQMAESPDGKIKYIILLDVEAEKTIVVEKEFFDLHFEESK